MIYSWVTATDLLIPKLLAQHICWHQWRRQHGPGNIALMKRDTWTPLPKSSQTQQSMKAGRPWPHLPHRSWNTVQKMARTSKSCAPQHLDWLCQTNFDLTAFPWQRNQASSMQQELPSRFPCVNQVTWSIRSPRQLCTAQQLQHPDRKQLLHFAWSCSGHSGDQMATSWTALLSWRNPSVMVWQSDSLTVWHATWLID